MNRFEIKKQVLLHSGVSLPTLVEKKEFVFITKNRQVLVVHNDPHTGLIAARAAYVEGRLIWHRGDTVCLIEFPDDLTEEVAEWARRLLMSAPDIGALHFLIRSLNEAPRASLGE